MALSPLRLRASMSAGSADTIAFTRSNSPALIASMKEALLDVASVLPRIHRGRAAGIVVALALAFAARPHAQTPRPEERPALGAAITVDPLGGLPSSAN